MDKWQPADIIAIIITLTIAFILVIGIVQEEPMTQHGEEIYGDLIIAYLTVLSMYIGYKIGKK